MFFFFTYPKVLCLVLFHFSLRYYHNSSSFLTCSRSCTFSSFSAYVLFFLTQKLALSKRAAIRALSHRYCCTFAVAVSDIEKTTCHSLGVDKNSLPFLDMAINFQPYGTIFCTWYQKPSDTGTILSYRSCAPLQHKKSIIQGTIHRLFRSTRIWKAFLEELTKNEKKGT